MAWRRRLSRRQRIAVIFLVVVVVAAALTGVRAIEGKSSAGFYLVIGASAARGFEPTGSMTPRGPAEAASDRGYANDLDAMLAAKGTSLTLDNIACPGETVQTFISGGDACTPTTSQLSRAETFLRENYEETGVVTIDVGFNNMRPCLQFTTVSESCVASTVALIRKDVPKALSELKKAAGPRVTFVGVPYGDPFLGHYLNSTEGPANATATLHAMNEMDTALDAAFEGSNIAVAPITNALKLGDTTMTGHYDGHVVPKDVAVACETTWMCRAAPWGPNDHPDNEGYSIIANAIADVLPASI